MEGLTVKTVDLPVTTDNQNPEGGFLAWLLLLGQQYGLPVNIPASDAYRAADRLRQCVAEGHLTGTERWTVLDVAAHIGWCSDAGILPAGWVRSGLEIAHRAFLGSGGSVPTLEPPADYLRAIAVEPGLRAVVRAVDALISMTGPTDQLCSGCVWSEIIKPICTPLIGEGRGYPPEQAQDPGEPGSGFVDLSPYLDALDDEPPEPESEIERWLRTDEAWHAFTDHLLARLDSVNPANGHGIGQVRSDPAHAYKRPGVDQEMET